MDKWSAFANDEMRELGNQYDTNIKWTASFSPWANGLNERNNATIDIIMEKMHENLPNVDENTALHYAVSVNCCLYLCSWIHTCSISHWTKSKVTVNFSWFFTNARRMHQQFYYSIKFECHCCCSQSICSCKN